LLAAIYSVAMYPLATRLFPGQLVSYPPSIGSQLAAPFGYWNSLGVFVAMGMLLAVGFATHGRSAALRAASAAALVPLACTLYLTFSRGAWLALAAATVVVFGLDPERPGGRADEARRQCLPRVRLARTADRPGPEPAARQPVRKRAGRLLARRLARVHRESATRVGGGQLRALLASRPAERLLRPRCP